jgi:hypothetical protein
MKRGFTISGLIGLLVAGSAVLVNPSVAQVTADQQAAEQGWRVRSNRAADLWFHGLAVVGLGMDDLFQLYHPDYVEQVRRAKRELGIYPTPLDSLADELLLKMEEEPELGALHFAPLHFPGASLDEMFRALIAVAAAAGGRLQSHHAGRHSLGVGDVPRGRFPRGAGGIPRAARAGVGALLRGLLGAGDRRRSGSPR